MNVELPLLLQQPVLTPAQKALLIRAQQAQRQTQVMSGLLAQLRRGRLLLARVTRRPLRRAA